MTPSPVRPQTLGLAPSFGFGDRIGSATPGHIAAMKRAGAGIAPIYAQQSIREMQRTQRDPETVMGDAHDAVAKHGWSTPVGADADHLKTEADVDCTARAGFVFFTIDPSAHVVDEAAKLDSATLSTRLQTDETHVDWLDQYSGRTVKLDRVTIDLSEEACLRAAVKYGQAIRHACRISDHVARESARLGRAFEIELSVDETEQPTTLAEHWIIADQCLQHGMKLVSLAPRFVGDFEKGVDFRGDLHALEVSLKGHAAIAAHLGPYKLSLHSGSDKLSMYAMLARATAGRFHVKTAGTSYLEAVRVSAKHDAKLFRRIVEFARARYATDRATYHVSAELNSTPEPSQLGRTTELERAYLGDWNEVALGAGFQTPGRQILHTTFGSVLTDPDLGAELRSCLDAHPDTHEELLEEHFARHLDALVSGL